MKNKKTSKRIITLLVMLLVQMSFGQKIIKGKAINTKTLQAKRNVKAIAKPMSLKRFDESKIRKLQKWEVITKNYVLIGDDNKYYTYDGDENTIKNHLENKKRNQAQSQLKKQDCPCFIYKKLPPPKLIPLIIVEDDYDPPLILTRPVINITNNPNVNRKGKIVIRDNNNIYLLKPDNYLLKKMKDSKHKKSQLKAGVGSGECTCGAGEECLSVTPNGCLCIEPLEPFEPLTREHIKSSKNYKKQLAEPKKEIKY